MVQEDKLAKLGWIPVNIGLLMATLILVVLLVFWLQYKDVKQRQQLHQHYQQQIFNGLVDHFTMAMAGWKERAALLVQQFGKAIADMSEQELANWQQAQLSQFKQAKRFCVLKEMPTVPDERACLPITYVSLHQLRQLKQTGQSNIVFIKAKETSHLLVLQSLGKQHNSAVLMMAIPPDVLKMLVPESIVHDGYIEISQGEDNVSPVVSFGRTQLKRQRGHFEQRLAGSELQLKYWAATAESGGWFYEVFVAALLFTGWLVQQLWLQVVLRHDANCLSRQIADYEELALKPSYPLVLSPLDKVTDAMQRLAALGSKQEVSSPRPLAVEAVEQGMFETETAQMTSVAETGIQVEELTDTEDNDSSVAETGIQVEELTDTEDNDSSVAEAGIQVEELADTKDHDSSVAETGIQVEELTDTEDHDSSVAETGIQVEELTDTEDHDSSVAEAGIQVEELTDTKDHDSSVAETGIQVEELTDTEDHDSSAAETGIQVEELTDTEDNDSSVAEAGIQVEELTDTKDYDSSVAEAGIQVEELADMEDYNAARLSVSDLSSKQQKKENSKLGFNLSVEDDADRSDVSSKTDD